MTLRCWVTAALRTSRLACYGGSCFVFIASIVITAARGREGGEKRKGGKKNADTCRKKIQFQPKPRHAFLNLKIIKVWDEYTHTQKNSSLSLCGINVCFVFLWVFFFPSFFASTLSWLRPLSFSARALPSFFRLLSGNTAPRGEPPTNMNALAQIHNWLIEAPRLFLSFWLAVRWSAGFDVMRHPRGSRPGFLARFRGADIEDRNNLPFSFR